MRDARAGATRKRILEAARALFADRGYLDTSVSDVAAAAGVSVQTIYNSVGGKGALLLALNDLLDVAGGVGPLQRRVSESADAAEVVALTSRLRRQLMEEGGDVIRALMEAAPSDAVVAAAWSDGQARSRAGSRRVAERLAELGALRPELDVDRAADSIYGVLHHGIWVRLVEECGWTADEFEAWCGDLLARLLLRRG